MKIAILSDVHANLPALERVLAHARALGVKEFWNLGDMAGFAPFPNETAALLKKICCKSIRGNYDVKALTLDRVKKMRKAGKDRDKIFSFQWTHDHLGRTARAFILSLPETLRVTRRGVRFLLAHGSPEGPEDELYPDTPRERFEELARTVRADVVVCGHTHAFFSRKAAGVLFVNPGSVGRPFDGDPRASYCVLGVRKGRVDVVPFRLDYDQRGLLKEARKQKFPPRILRMLKEARSLDRIKRGSFEF